MIQISEYEYHADEGKVIVHKETGQRYGTGIHIGVIDNIDNYIEEDITPEDIKFIYGSDENEEEKLEENKNEELD